MDSVAANATFAEKYQFPYPLLSDTGGQVCQAYGTCTDAGEIRRNTVIIDPHGNVAHIFEDVQPEGHVETVLTFLQAATTAVAPTKEHRLNNNLNGGPASLRKGAQATMDEQQHVENGTVCPVIPQEQADAPLEPQPASDVDSPMPATISPSGVAAATTESFFEPLSAAQSGQVQPSQANNSPSLVFALGTLGYDFSTEARRDSIAQHMAGPNNQAPNPQDPAQWLAYLEANPDQAAAVIWTLSIDATPIYAILPRGPFAAIAYDRLQQFLREQISEGVERISVAGVIIGQVRLMSGQTVPAIWPELRCMYSWSTGALVEAVAGEPPDESAGREAQEAYAQRVAAVVNFLERVYYELRNLGTTPQERAINYAATNALTAAGIFEAALQAEMELDTIEVERSPICRPDSECWDVVLCFFDPENTLRSRKCYRFTVDVSDICPVMVGTVRSWSMR